MQYKQKNTLNMDKKMTFWSAALFVALYFVAVFATEFIGFIHPLCWVMAPAVGALAGAFAYVWLWRRWQGFGLGTVLAAVFGLLMLAMGEMDLARLGIVVGCGLLSDLVRLRAKSCYITYPLLALGNIAEIIYLWTRKQWYVQGAADEMGQAYADTLAKMQTSLWCGIAIGAILMAAVLGVYIAKRVVK